MLNLTHSPAKKLNPSPIGGGNEAIVPLVSPPSAFASLAIALPHRFGTVGSSYTSYPSSDSVPYIDKATCFPDFTVLEEVKSLFDRQFVDNMFIEKYLTSTTDMGKSKYVGNMFIDKYLTSTADIGKSKFVCGGKLCK